MTELSWGCGDSMNYELHTMLRHQHPPWDHVMEHAHTVYEVVFYLRGRGTSTINNVAYQYQDRSMVIIAPGEMHDETAETESEVLICSFSLGDGEDAAAFKSTYIPDTGVMTDRVYDVLCRIENELRAQEQGYQEMIGFLLGEMVLLFERLMGHKRDSDSIIDYTKRVLKQNAERGVNLQIIAESVGYSYDRFRHLFKESTGQSPNQYLIGIRIAHAKQLLAGTDMAVKQIAALCGFKDVPNFIIAFKRRTYLTPSEYRRLALESEAGEVRNIGDWTQQEDREDHHGHLPPR